MPLYSEQHREEADGLIILHAKHACPGISSIINIAENTDVILLCLAFQTNIDCACLSNVVQNLVSVSYDISKVAKAIGLGICEAILGMHVFTGCDNVSVIRGCGKL